jgi:hypothetical protein
MSKVAVAWGMAARAATRAVSEKRMMDASARDDKEEEQRERESKRVAEGEDKKQGSSRRAGVFLYQLAALQSGVVDYENSLRATRAR